MNRCLRCSAPEVSENTHPDGRCSNCGSDWGFEPEFERLRGAALPREYPTARAALAAPMGGDDVPVMLSGRYFVVAQEDADLLAAIGLEMTYLAETRVGLRELVRGR